MPSGLIVTNRKYYSPFFSETEVNLLVFVDLSEKEPYLLKIGQEEKTVIKTYLELNSASPKTRTAIAEEIIDLSNVSCQI